MPTLHVGLLEYTWKLIGEGSGRYKVKENGAKGSTVNFCFDLMNYFLYTIHHIARGSNALQVLYTIASFSFNFQLFTPGRLIMTVIRSRQISEIGG